ncbi:MAG: protease complex subunit PrcB family protein [Flavobacterium sp.]|nr:protease complex subunit PrcB family protein [Flavobacterium sp.]
MKKALILFSLLFLISCSTSHKTVESKPLYEILTSQEDGGATIRFFEILSEEREIKMLQNDEFLKNKINADDTKTANFVILNMGEKTTLGYSISVQNVEETTSKIIITTNDNEPKSKRVEEKEVFYYPYTIVKVNSKKEIVIQ